MTELPHPEECVPGIWRVALPMSNGFMSAVNVYLAEDEHGFTLFDCGLANDESWEALNEALDSLHIRMAHVDRILLTHTHPDHAGLATRIADASGATIWVHQYDREYFNRRFIHNAELKQQLAVWLTAHGAPEAEAMELAYSIEGSTRLTRPLPDSETYREGQHIELGPYVFEVAWTPGHTPGHVCFSDRAQRLLICGDHVLPNVSPNIGMQPDSDVNPMPGYLASLQELAESEIETTLPGHGRSFEIQARARDLLTHQLGRQQRLLDLLSERGPTTAYELAEIVWSHSRPQSWARFRPVLRRNGINTLAAHLELLRDQGRATRSNELPYRYEAQ